ncbi:hypothetical protein FB563_1567 [Streptomyces puniciscabiei]|uniref:Uncharacterized protein n=1 Tax=Streptomyces puniciscabiei TaxID=164348 RepID=A0A542UC06_9ACTN|nr:hypothetical protein FB563_1567 [Streptomyces puniciscabiei]
MRGEASAGSAGGLGGQPAVVARRLRPRAPRTR